jgi:hypothetical protein
MYDEELIQVGALGECISNSVVHGDRAKSNVINEENA